MDIYGFKALRDIRIELTEGRTRIMKASEFAIIEKSEAGLLYVFSAGNPAGSERLEMEPAAMEATIESLRKQGAIFPYATAESLNFALDHFEEIEKGKSESAAEGKAGGKRENGALCLTVALLICFGMYQLCKNE